MLSKTENDMAERRYRETLDRYRNALGQNPSLTLKAYCQMRHVYYRGLLGWMRKEDIKKPVHKTSRGLKEGRGSASGSGLRYDMGEVFIQIYPDEYLQSLQEGRR